MTTNIGNIIAMLSINMILFIPLLILVSKEKRYYVQYYTLIFFLTFLVSLLSAASRVNSSLGLTYNFIGKTLSFLISLYFVYYLVRQTKQLTMEDLFLTKGTYKGSKKLILISIGILTAFALTSLFYSQTFSVEALIFQLTLPGLDEELSMRALGLGLLIKAFHSNDIEINPVKSIPFWFLAFLFGSIHAVPILLADGRFLNALYIFFVTGLIGALFELITLKTKSILLPIILHNSYNTLHLLLALI